MAGAGRDADPDPERAADLADFIDLLGELRVWAGQPSYRMLAARVGPLLRPPQKISHSTVSDVFQRRRRRLDLDLVVALVRAMGVDEAAVDRWRSACVRVHSEAKTGSPAGVFRQLPADLATFTGRREELARLLQAAQAPSDAEARTVVISAIEGMGGVGKTQLAVHAAHELVRAGRYTDVQLYVNLRGFDPDEPPTDPAVVLDAFLRQLGVPGPQIPAGTDARAAMFRDRVHGRDALILLDNAADEDQVRDLIPAGETCLVLITSRRSLAGLDGATVHPLGVFSPEEAVDLLVRIVGAERVRPEPEAAEAVVRACGLLPLAVALVAARVRSRPAWTLTDLAARLRADGLDAVSAGRRSLRPVFDLSYQGLEAPERHLFRLLGLHPGEDFTASSAAALAGVGVSEALTVLERLQDEYLLQEKPGGRYGKHDLLKAYAAERALDEVPAGEREEALGRLIAWYVRSASNAADLINLERARPGLDRIPPAPQAVTFADRTDALEWLQAERANLNAAAALAATQNANHAAWVLPATLMHFHIQAGSPTELEQISTLGLAAARKLDDPEGQVWMLFSLAVGQRGSGRLREALDTLREALPQAEATGDPVVRVSAMTLHAGTLHQLGRYSEALPWYEAALPDMRTLARPGMLAGTLNNLGYAHHALDHHDLAVEYYREALDVLRSADRPAPFVEAHVLDSLGRASHALGDTAGTIGFLNEAIDLREQLGDQQGRAASLDYLGELYHSQGDEQSARSSWQRALEALDGHSNPPAVALRDRLTARLDG